MDRFKALNVSTYMGKHASCFPKDQGWLLEISLIVVGITGRVRRVPSLELRQENEHHSGPEGDSNGLEKGLGHAHKLHLPSCG